MSRAAQRLRRGGLTGRGAAAPLGAWFPDLSD